MQKSADKNKLAGAGKDATLVFFDSLLRFLKGTSLTSGASQIIKLLRSELHKTLGFRRVWLYQLSEDGLRFEFLTDAVPGFYRHPAARSVTIKGDAYLEDLRDSADLIIVNDAQVDPRLNREIVTLLNIRTLIHQPVEILGQRCLIGTGSFGTEGVVCLGPAERDYFRSITRAAALAMERAALLESRNSNPAINISTLPKTLLNSSLPMLTFWERDLNTGKLTATPLSDGSFGYPDETGVDTFEKYLAMVHPDDVPGLKANVESYLANPAGRLQIIYRLLHKNGTFRWIYSEAGVIYDEEKRPQKLAGFRFDITNRKNAEIQASASEARIHILLEQGEISLWDLDLGSLRLTYSSSVTMHLGYNVTELPADLNDWFALLHPDDSQTARKTIQDFTSQKSGSLDAVFRMRHWNGTYRYIRIRADLESNSEGSPVRALGCSIDITTQKLHEISMNSQVEHLKTLVRGSPVLMAMLDTDLNILAASHSYTDAFHRGNTNLQGLMHSPMHHNIPARWLEIIRKAQTGEFHHGEADEWVMADGRKYLLRWSIGPWFDLENRIGGIILAADDMTRSRELEQEVLDIAGQFQQRLSVDLHDTVCQELTALAIYAESLGFSIPEEDHQARTILGRIEDGLKRCTADVRQLIHGKLPVNVTGQGFVQAIQEMATNDNQWSKWQIKVIIDSSPVNLDDFTATQLYMIIKEAVHNAIKHARPEEIRICISARPHLCISVQNQLAEGQKATGFVQKTGLGRKIMEHRAAMIGGQIRFETTEKYRVQLSCELERIAYDR